MARGDGPPTVALLQSLRGTAKQAVPPPGGLRWNGCGPSHALAAAESREAAQRSCCARPRLLLHRSIHRPELFCRCRALPRAPDEGQTRRKVPADAGRTCQRRSAASLAAQGGPHHFRQPPGGRDLRGGRPALGDGRGPAARQPRGGECPRVCRWAGIPDEIRPLRGHSGPTRSSWGCRLWPPTQP